MSSIPNTVRMRILWRRLKHADWPDLLLTILVILSWGFIIAYLGLGMLTS